jgi:hypothetical protein
MSCNFKEAISLKLLSKPNIFLINKKENLGASIKIFIHLLLTILQGVFFILIDFLGHVQGVHFDAVSVVDF